MLPMSDIIRGNLSDNMQLPLEPQKDLHYFFTYAWVLPKTALMCKIGGITLYIKVTLLKCEKGSTASHMEMYSLQEKSSSVLS